MKPANTIISLPDGRKGAALALGLTVLGLAVPWFGLVAPALDWYDARQEELIRQTTLSRHMRALADTLPRLREQAAALRDEPGQAQAALPGGSDAIAAAWLQQKLEDLAREGDLHFASTETLAAESAGTSRAVSVRVTLTASWPRLIELLRSIAASSTAMVVDNLQLRALEGDMRTSMNSREPDETGRMVNAAFSVTGWRHGGPDGP